MSALIRLFCGVKTLRTPVKCISMHLSTVTYYFTCVEGRPLRDVGGTGVLKSVLELGASADLRLTKA